MAIESVLACIITYNPDISLFDENIKALSQQVDRIVVYDNASTNANEIRKIITKYSNAELYVNDVNEGLPKNYNRALKICKENNFHWLLTMDQDTVIPPEMIRKFMSVSNISEIAIVSPVLVDTNIESLDEVKAKTPKEEYSYIDYCISSASLNRVSILDSLGGFDEKLFIDQVDFDYCRNVTEHGYKVVRVNDTFISHKIGNGKIVRLFGKPCIAYNHPPIRKYYFFRNRVYFARKYHITLFNEPAFYRNFVKHFIVLFFEKNRFLKIRQALRGIRDGKKL